MSEHTGGPLRRPRDHVAHRNPGGNPNGHFSPGKQQVIDPKLICDRNPYGDPRVDRVLREVDLSKKRNRDVESTFSTMQAMWECGASAADIGAEFETDAESVRSIAKNRKWRRK